MARGPQDRFVSVRGRGVRARRLGAGLAAVVAAGGLAAGPAQASTTIFACYSDSTDVLSYLAPPATSCPSGSTEISWAQAGPQGPQGAKGMNFRGLWGSTDSYAVGDVVFYSGSSWYAKVANTGSAPPGTDWIMVAEKGAQGARGAQGAQGAKGAQGAQGAQGAKGAQGSQGAPGAQGAAGPQGSQGAPGGVGLQGAQGAQGPQGDQGPSGPPGATTVWTYATSKSSPNGSNYFPTSVSVAVGHIADSVSETSVDAAVNAVTTVKFATDVHSVRCWLKEVDSSGSSFHTPAAAATAVANGFGTLAVNGVFGMGTRAGSITEYCRGYQPPGYGAFKLEDEMMNGVQVETIHRLGAAPAHRFIGPRRARAGAKVRDPGK